MGRRLISAGSLTVLVILTAGAVWLAGCSANDPFDPNSVANHPPTVRLFVAPVNPDADLSPTSYFDRTFQWNGTDQDGWVTEYFVSIRTETGVPAAWDTTTRTDTTMTFVTDENGQAEATFLLVCRDNRGALSDTMIQFVPLKNFPPVVNFQSDFEPLSNLQREFHDALGNVVIFPDSNNVVADTTYWNWGPSNFRLFALDLDGAATMASHFRYTLMDTAGGDPEMTWNIDDPGADPEKGWVRAPFEGLEEIRKFEIYIRDVTPNPNTLLTISVTDEANADARFHYSWEVRAPKGNVLYIPHAKVNSTRIYREALDNEYGENGWDEYGFWFGFPDRGDLLLDVMRLFDLVLMTEGGGVSNHLRQAAKRDGVLERYIQPTDGADPGQLLLVSKAVTSSTSGLSTTFVQEVLGISPTGSPQGDLMQPLGKQALPVVAHLVPMTVADSQARGAGLVPLAGTEALFRMEECVRCYNDRRPPWDPIVVVRRPEFLTDPVAQVLTVGLQLEHYSSAEVLENMHQFLSVEMGVSAP